MKGISKIAVVYYLTAFLSAFLIFFIQPVIPKKLLPILGGAPALWNTCLLFYQITLLVGYAYTHVASRFLSPRRHALMHLALLAGAAAFLPLSISTDIPSLSEEGPVFWVLHTLVSEVGMLFFLLCTTAPLLQRWISATWQNKDEEPYYIYAISNTGSMTALFSYAFIIEPRFAYSLQLSLWSIGYWCFLGLVALCAVHVVLRGRQFVLNDKDTSSDLAPSIADRLWWTVLAFIPTSLMMGVTTYITSDIAAVPLLWILPLAIYLLTYILTFSRRALYAGRKMLTLQKVLLILAAFNFLTTNAIVLLITAKGMILFQLLIFSVSAFICHSQLSKRRPNVSYLTEFYLFISIGGALGGIFNALLAPALFNSDIEYPLMIVIAFMVAHYKRDLIKSRYVVDILVAAIFGVTVFLAQIYIFESPNLPMRSAFILYAAIFFYVIRKRYWALSLCIVIMCIGGDRSLLSDYSNRSYFGIHKVYKDSIKTTLVNGKILHGLQYHDPKLRTVPRLYFAYDEPFGAMYSAIRKHRRIRSVGIIGLGAGTMAAYAEAGQRWVFYELDPVVVNIASNPEYFTYLSDSKGNIEIETGDGRLLLEESPENTFDIIVIDAFSSDSIPVHLLTKEAFDMFSSKLTDNGVIIYHISNRFLDISKPLQKLAQTEGKASIYCRNNSDWFAIAMDTASVDILRDIPMCHEVNVRENFRLWTDDYSSIFNVLK